MHTETLQELQVGSLQTVLIKESLIAQAVLILSSAYLCKH